MATYGRAAVFAHPNKDLELQEFPVPDPEPGAVVIRVKRCNVCGSDLHAWHGDFQTRGLGGQLPTILGHEMTGVVHSLGAGIQTDSFGNPLHIGDRVVYPYFFACGRCENCTSGFSIGCRRLKMAMLDNCLKPPHFVGGFADYYYLPPQHVIFKVPDELGDDVVSGANCALSQVMYGLDRVGLRAGETVVIQGSGGLGIYATAVAKTLGARRVIVLDGVEERLALARKFGADEIIPLSQHDEKERLRLVREFTNGLGADVAVEVVGHPGVISEGLRLLRVGGRYLEIGNISLGKTVELDPSRLVFGNKSIIGVSLYEPRYLKKALDFLVMTRNAFPYNELVARTFPLSEINEAFRLAEAKQVNRASIVMDV
ncbi:zinc-binding dehydrogenase [Kyrpidia tusciae]|uniref:Alcohol dehydrogenase zinc-binding domain protein n=1 Tax=Kyrpidia tusciae (strain DSM 2912 / NBRC 15312 / T2) TaxID=562970 RepID=D5WXV1_KYRT2|nr:zinc-binding dehydrogenase [Kyrpidia tusciae]ADG06010.1 Alcohol dehydrogenase zinc-binding domain protein [Kyrpidia tusciae DSM 2912]